MSDDIFALSACYLNGNCDNNQQAQLKALTDDKTITCTSSGCSGATGTLEKIADEMDSSIKKISNLDNRELKVSNYYGKKKSAQNNIIKWTMGIFAVAALLWLAGTYFPIFPSWLITILLSLTFGIGAIIILFKVADVNRRDNTNFDEYDVEFGPLPKLPESSAGDLGSDINTMQYSPGNFGKNCMNGDCCPNFFSFSASKGYCAFDPLSGTSLSIN